MFDIDGYLWHTASELVYFSFIFKEIQQVS